MNWVPSTDARLIEQAQARGLLPAEATAFWQAGRGPSWVVAVLGFLGAQLVALNLLALLGALTSDFLFRAPGAFVGAVLLIGGAAWVLRATRSLFVTQLAFSPLLAGLVLLVVGMDWRWDNGAILLYAALLVAVALVVRAAWVQRLLGALAGALLLALIVWPPLAVGLGDAWRLLEWRWRAYPMAINATVLGLACVAWMARETRSPGGRLTPALAALVDGAGVALLLALAGAALRALWTPTWLTGGPAGSVDMAGAGTARIFQLSGYALVQMALVTGAAAWLWRHWQFGAATREGREGREQRLLALVYGALLVACLVIPQVGVVALMGTLALGTGRRALLGLALSVLLAQGAGFYYALAWPLAHKAALLAGLGAALAVALMVLRARQTAVAPQAAPTPRARPWGAWALVVLGAVLALAVVHRDVQEKEQVIAQGQKIFVPLAPRDPRSLMQGDYMALHFALPPEVLQALGQDDPLNTRRHALIVVRLDARGVAQVLRAAHPGEALAPGERLLQARRMKGAWTLVTDAYFFPEGRGAPFAFARFGDMRALPDGRTMLVGLADADLRPIAPAPRTAAQE